MKYLHTFILVSSICAISQTSVLAQGGPPAFPSGPPPADPATAPAATSTQDAEETATEEETNARTPRSFTPPTRTSRTDRPVLPARTSGSDSLQSFEFTGADLDTVMTMYCEWTGKHYLKSEGVNASVSLKVDRLTIAECVDAVEAILAMNNIIIVPYGEKFVKVVQSNSADLTGQGGVINYDENTEYNGTDRVVSQMIPLKNVQIKEVQTAIQHLMHSYGKIQTLEGSNSLLITDTESNIVRIRELVDFLDQASARIEPRFYEIIYAESTEIASKLTEIIEAAQSDQQTSTTSARTTSSRATATRSIRASRTTATAPVQATISSTQASAQSIVQGSVKVMADERTNLIIIFSQKENFDFFDRMIKMLDVEVEPAITFEVVNLEYADAEELASTLNSLIGASSSSTASRTSSSSSSSSSSSRNSTSRNTSSSSRNSSSSSSARMTPNASPVDGVSFQNLTELSENTKILADTRSNSILLTGRKSDITAIKQVIASLDVMLEQVMIEADIFEIGLTKGLDHGIQWLYQSQSGNELGGWDVSTLATNGIKSVASGALKYYQNVTGIDTEMAIKLAASDNNARVLGTPIIMTTDNTEATLSIGEQRPVVTSTSSYANSSGTTSSQYEYKDIGIQLTVTPRINPQRFVVMEISQQADQLGGTVSIDDNDVPIILNREFQASVAIPDRGTIALGGLMTTEKDDSVSKIPILGDIPLIGRLLFSRVSKSEVQRELLVLLTPYVMTNHEEIEKETERIYQKTSLAPEDWNWSESKLRLIPDEEQ